MALTRGLKKWVSLTVRPLVSTLVAMLARTPQIRCASKYSRLDFAPLVLAVVPAGAGAGRDARRVYGEVGFHGFEEQATDRNEILRDLCQVTAGEVAVDGIGAALPK